MDELARGIGYLVIGVAIMFAIGGVIAVIFFKMGWDDPDQIKKSKIRQVFWNAVGVLFLLFLLWLVLGRLAE